jgi:hypothetical protein
MSGNRWIFLTVALVGLILAARNGPDQADAKNPTTERIYAPLIINHPAMINNMFGVQMYGLTGKSSSYYDALVQTDAKWIRAEANWKYVESTRDNYYWLGLDEELAAARGDQGGYNMIVTVLSAPSWAASTPQGRINKVPISEFTDFVGALVERYDGDGYMDAPGSPVINYWEFYNEPDYYANWGDYGADYAAMLGAVYPVVKAANPRAQVVFGGVAHDWFEDQGGPFVRSFLDDVFSSPGGDRFDVMNFHLYAAFWSNWTTRGVGLIEKTQAIRNRMQANGLALRPIVITETGWCSEGCNDPDSKVKSEQNQARYVVALFTQSVVARIDVMTWWMLYDLDPERAGHLYAFGLVSDDSQPKLSMQAYRTAVDKLGWARYERTWSDSETGNHQVEFYQFRDDRCGCRRYVGWLNPLETTSTRSFLVPHSLVKVYEGINGTLVATLKDGDDGKVDGKTRVTVSGAPRYFEGK